MPFTYSRKLLVFLLWLLIAKSTAVAPVTHQPKRFESVSADPTVLLQEAIRLAWLDNWTAAVPLFTRAEELFGKTGDTRNALYAHLGSLRSQALPLDAVSRSLTSALKNPVVKTDLRLRLWCLVVKGYTDLDLNTPSAKRAWMEALSIANLLGDRQWELRAKGELGVIAFLEGNPAQAVSFVGQALLSMLTTGDRAGEARLLSMLGRGYNEVHRYAEANWFFNQAISLMERTPDAGFPFNAAIGNAETLAHLGHPEQALNVLDGLLNTAREQSAHGHEADVLMTLGELAANTQEITRAEQVLGRAAEISHSLHLYRDLAQVMLDLAHIYRAKSDVKKADLAVQAGLVASRQLGDRYYLPRDLTAAAELKVAEGKWDEADVLFGKAERVIDEMLVNQHTDIGKAALAGSMSETYLEHFHLVQQRGQVARAFHLLERVRGRSWPVRISDSGASTATSASTAALEAKIAAIQVKLLAAEDDETRTQLLDQLLQNERTLAFAENEQPQPIRPAMRPAYLQAVQGVLREDELLIEYVLDDPAAFCIAITATEADIVRLPAGEAQIQKQVASYLRELSQKHSRPDLAKGLYRILFGGVAEKFQKSRWIIAPDGILHFLPFEALEDSHGTFVLTSHVVSYTSSATAVHTSRSIKRRKSSLPLIAVGDVAYQNRHISRSDNQRTAWIPLAVRGLAELSQARLHDLPQSREEVLAIAQIAGPGSRVLLGREATETALKREPLSDYRIIHLAVHAIADSRYPDRSALVLAADQPPEDGLLQVREIARMNLSADLVTLSACQTGIGTTEGEAGVISLEEAFLNAGAKAVVASLWNVDDDPTTQLMKAFYRHLAENEDKAAALRNAKQEVLDANANISPYYWAGFVLVGEGSTRVPFEKTEIRSSKSEMKD